MTPLRTTPRRTWMRRALARTRAAATLVGAALVGGARLRTALIGPALVGAALLRTALLRTALVGAAFVGTAFVGAAFVGSAFAAPVALSPAAVEALRAGGAVLVMRHATAPGVGDPSGFRADDCSTQRNLSAEGRAEARELGAQLRAAGIRFTGVSSSPWCRCMDTAELVFGARPEPDAALASVFDDRGKAEAEARTETLRQRLRAWRGPGNLAWVSHQVNLSMLVGRGLASNQALVLVPDDSPGGFRVLDLHRPG